MPIVPTLSVVISTRNRGDTIVACLRSLLLDPDAFVEVLVVDQSDDQATEAGIRREFSDPRLTYHRSAGRGVAAGRNHGTGLSRAAIVAMTDDDCEVGGGWLESIRRTFDDPRIGLAFGGVRPGPHDPKLGFIPACPVAAPFLATRVRDKARLDGMGACMAFRRDLWETLGGFDESFGAGTAFQSGEETDFCLRALIARRAVLLTPAFEVVHHGFRTVRDGEALVHGYWYGTGGVFGKLGRAGHMEVAAVLLRLGWRFLFGASPVARSLAGAATRGACLKAFARGIWDGSRSVNGSGQSARGAD